jgi:hypothetical protein
MGKLFVDFIKVIFKIILTLLWGATQLVELILKHLNELFKSIITKH